MSGNIERTVVDGEAGKAVIDRRSLLAAIGMASGCFMSLPTIATTFTPSRKTWEPDGSGARARIGVIAALEEDLGRPVLTANQVAFWYALRLAGVGAEVDEYGQVFRKHPDRK